MGRMSPMGQMGLISLIRRNIRSGLCQTDRGGEQPTMLSRLRKTADGASASPASMAQHRIETKRQIQGGLGDGLEGGYSATAWSSARAV